MSRYTGKFEAARAAEPKRIPFFLIPLSFVLIELYAMYFLLPEGDRTFFPAKENT